MRLVRFVAGMAGMAVLATPTLASADPGQQDEGPTTLVEELSPYTTEDSQTPLSGDADGYLAGDRFGVSTELPIDPTQKILLSSAEDTSATIAITLPEEADVNPGVESGDGMVSYSSMKDSGVSVVAEAPDGNSVRLNTVLESAEAPNTLTYHLDLPDNAVLTLNEDGSIAALDGDTWLAGVAAPWAKDANGNDLPTHYELVGNGSFSQVIETNDTTAYPVVADPWLGISLVKKTAWTYNSKSKGYTLQVYPSTWGRSAGGTVPTSVAYVAMRLAFWNEVKAKTSGSREETPSMRDQMYCHIDVVRLRAPNKTSWNLDTWRPNVSYAKMLAEQCNP